MSETPALALNDGRRIPQLGLGVFKVAPDEAVRVIHEAITAGYRSIDTATLYGNETEVGQAVRSASVPRGELYITTKLWNEDHGYDRALKAFDQSMKRLGLDYVDLYLIHWPCPRRNAYVETWKALIRIREEGRARSIGVSNFHIPHLQRVIDETGVVPTVNQVELHPWLAQRPLREFHRQQGIVTEAWSPLARAAVLTSSVLEDLGRKHGKSPAQIALRWHIQSDIVAIPKSVHPARIRENISIFDFTLSEGDLAALARLDTAQRVGPDPETVG